MSEAKHTPAPWKAEFLRGRIGFSVIAESWPKPLATTCKHPDVYYTHKKIITASGEEVTTFTKPTPDGETRKAEVEAEEWANASLMAAAPELLEAAKEAIQELGRIGHQDNPEFPEFQKLCAAVDKAEGDQ